MNKQNHPRKARKKIACKKKSRKRKKVNKNYFIGKVTQIE